MMVSQGQYDQCLINAQKHGIEVLSRYLFGLANKFLKSKDYDKSLNYLIQYEVPPVSAQFKFYRSFCIEIIQEGKNESFKLLKDMVRKLISNMKSSGSQETAIKEFEKI